MVLKTKTGEHVLFTYRGANDKLTTDTKTIKNLKTARGIYIASLSGNWKRILSAVIDSGVPFAWNPGRQQISSGYKVLKPYISRAEVLIVNKDEATEIVLSAQLQTKKTWTSRELAKTIASFGPQTVVVTEGAKGAAVYSQKKLYYQKAQKAKAIDTTGVGDSFAAAFIVGLFSTKNIPLALRAASKNAASVVSKTGAQNGLLTRAQLGL